MDRLRTEARNQTRLAVFTMDTHRLGEELLALCRSEENKFAEIQELLGSLAEVQRREVLRYRDQVSESSAYYVHVIQSIYDASMRSLSYSICIYDTIVLESSTKLMNLICIL